MTDFLTEEWFPAVIGAAGDLPKIDGLSAIIGFEVSGAPTAKKLRAHATLVDGQLTDFVIGKSKEMACEVGISAEKAQAFLLGEIDPAAEYMRGDIKLSGDYEVALFELRPLVATDGWSDFIAAVVAATTF